MTNLMHYNRLDESEFVHRSTCEVNGCKELATHEGSTGEIDEDGATTYYSRLCDKHFEETLDHGNPSPIID